VTDLHQKEATIMAEPTKIVKGGFRATLALLVSIIALIFSILAFSSSKSEEALKARIQDLQATMEKMKAESTEQLDKLRNETANTLEKISKTIKKEEAPEQLPGGTTN